MKDHKSTYKATDDDSGIVIQHSQKIDDIVDTNAEMAEQSQAGNDMKLAARIPMNVIFAWEQEGIEMAKVGICPDMTARFWKKLQDPNWSKLRVWDGKVV